MKKRYTKEGLEKLKKELSYLEKEKRKEVADKLKYAASFGDLSENSAYDDAKNEQDILETQISKLKTKITEANVVEDKQGRDFVQIGSQLEIEIDGQKKKIEIVDGSDADPIAGKMSCESPMGKTLLGKKPGEVCNMKIPSGEKKIKILNIV